jgi:predicted metalloendopeptidase
VDGQRSLAAPNTQSGIDLDAMNKTASACTDFYQYGVRRVDQSHPLPADRATYARFTEVDDRNTDVLQDILEKTSADAADLDARKSGDYTRAASTKSRSTKRRGAARRRPRANRLGDDALASRAGDLRASCRWRTGVLPLRIDP